MKKIRFFARILMAVLLLVPAIAHAAGPDIPPPPTGGVGVLDFLMNLFAAIFNFLMALFGSLPGIPG